MTPTTPIPPPAPGAPIEDVRAYVGQFTDLGAWPEPTPERLSRLRSLFGFAYRPVPAEGTARRAG